MKYKAHIPTEQYGFVEVEFEQGEGHDIAGVYAEVSATFKPKEGIDEKSMNTFIDNQLLGNSKNHLDTYNQMSEVQKFAVQTIKRGLKRISAKEE